MVGALLATPLLSGQESRRFEPPQTVQEALRDEDFKAAFIGSYRRVAETEPEVKDEEVRFLRETLLPSLEGGNYSAAIAILEAEFAKTPDVSAPIRFVLANLYFQEGQREKAEEQYRVAIKAFDEYQRAHRNLGLLLTLSERYVDARVHLSRAVELGARDAANFGLLGFCNMQAEDFVAAEQAYRNAILLQPNESKWTLGLAQAMVELEKYTELLGLLDTVLAEDPDNVNLWMLQANAQLGLERPVEAALALEIARNLGNPDRSLLKLLGDIYVQQEIFDLALGAYEELIDSGTFPEDFDDGLRAARLFQQTRNSSKADALLNRLRAQYAQQISGGRELELLVLEAKVQRSIGNPEEAAKTLEQVVSRDATRGEALIELADFYWSQSQEKAKRAATLEADGEEDQAEAVLQEAETLKTLALSRLDSAARQEEFSYDALVKHAQFLVRERDYDGAVEKLRAALKIKEEPRVRRFLGKIEEAAQARS